MFFFDWVTLTTKPKRARSASKVLPPRTPYTRDGHYTIGQKVEHPDPDFGPGTVTLVLINKVVILFDSEKWNPPPRVYRGIHVKGHLFLSATLTLQQRDKANGATFPLVRLRSITNFGAAARSKRKKGILEATKHRKSLRQRYWPALSTWWQGGHPTGPLRTGSLHGLVLHRAA